MKTSAKEARILGLILLFAACLSFGYAIGRQIWGLRPFAFPVIISGMACFFIALLMFRLAKKKKNEENQSSK
jgi:predicted permease